jgi:hypothetical protein
VRLEEPRKPPLPDGTLQLGVVFDTEARRREELFGHYVTFGGSARPAPRRATAPSCG